MTGDGFSVHRDDASAPFFDAAAEGRLIVRRCPRCGDRFPPQVRRCADGTDLEWMPSAGAGRLVTWAVDHGPPLDPTLAAPGGATSVVGVVEIDDGLWLNAAIVDVDPATLTEGAPVRVRFVRPGGGEPVPVFSTDDEERRRAAR